MFLNVSNHPSNMWQQKQLDAAHEYGEIVDFGHPDIPAFATEDQMRKIVAKSACEIEALAPDVVFLAGEFTLVFMLADELLRRGVKVISATSERITEETKQDDGTMQKVSKYNFVQFRKYARYRE